MKNVAWIVAGLMAGFLLGGIGPRRELAATQAGITDLQARVETAEKKASRHTSDRFLGLPAFPEMPHAAMHAAAAGSPVSGVSPDPSPSGTPFDPMQAFSLAAEAQRIRAKQSRAVIVEAAKLDRKQQEKLDDVVSRMNDQLGKHAAEIASLMGKMNEGQEPDPLELLSLTKDVSGILLESQTAFQEVTGNPQGADESATQVWNYVDLNIFKDVVQNLPPNLAPHP